MTPALVVTIICFLFGMGIQAAIFAYYYGRLTMKVDMIETSVGGKASKEHLGNVETMVTKLSTMFEKFLTDVDGKFDRARDSDQRDDARLLGAVAHLEAYMEEAVNWIGERMGTVGRVLDAHERVVQKVAKINNVSYERFPAQTGNSTMDTGQHQVIPPPPRPGSIAVKTTATGMPRMPTNPDGRKSDPRAE